MSHQVVFAEEAAAAHGAGEGALPAVDPFVTLQVGFLDEAVSAHIAAEGALPGVNLLVAAQVLPAAEPFPTVSAGERPLSAPSAVRLLMGVQMGLRYKAPAALITGERLISAHRAILVNPLVSE